MITICLKTLNGHFLIADTTGAIAATPDGVGDWELFQVFRPDGTVATSLNHNDQIALRTHFGKYIMATNAGGGSLGVASRVQAWETFTIEKIFGAGAITHNSRVTLRANDGRHFIMAYNAGGGEVSCVSTNRAEWETFTLQYWNRSLFHILAHDGHYLRAENSVGREISANRNVPTYYETFRLINRTRATGFQSGDSIVIQTWSGNYLSAGGGGGGTVKADRNRSTIFETFKIIKAGGGFINPGDRVSFQTSNGIHFLMARNGGGDIINAMASLAREWETFTIVNAQNLPIPFGLAPNAPATAGNPFATRPTRVTGRKRIVALFFGFADSLADDSITQADFRNAIFGPTLSLKSWFEKNSYGAMTFEGNAFGPFNVPWRYHTDPVTETNAYFNGILTEAERLGFSLRDFDTDHDGVLGTEDVMFLLMDCSGYFGAGNSGGAAFNFRGISYNGLRLNVGLYPRGGPRYGLDQLNSAMCTVAHELCHMFFGFPDRYYAPFPPLGDVSATSTSAIHLARHRIEFIGSSVGNVRIKSAHGNYWVPDRTTSQLLNGGGIASNPDTSFELSRADGSVAVIRHMDSIRIKSNTLSRYVMVRWGGGDTVSVIASAASVWETFNIERQSGAGIVQNGDFVFFRTSNRNPFSEQYYLVTQPFNIPEIDPPNWRHNDPATLANGWWDSWHYSSTGAGGAYDVMDNSHKKSSISAYDRLKKGWMPPRVLIPENKAWYVLKPSIDFPESIVLWDPFFPDEWYIVENRQNRTNEDVIPSSGLIITWVNESNPYWLNWRRNIGFQGLVPAVISAANPSLPPNPHVLTMLQNGKFYKRSDPNTAFRSGEVVLPKGDGTPSRFVLEVRPLTGEQMAFCIK